MADDHDKIIFYSFDHVLRRDKKLKLVAELVILRQLNKLNPISYF